MAAKENVILAIDPGTTQSAYAMIREDYSIISAAKVGNEELLTLVKGGEYDALVVEFMEARTLNADTKALKAGKRPRLQKIGKETYTTCRWIGRFEQVAVERGKPVSDVYRSEEKNRLIPTKKNRLQPLPEPVPKSADAQIRAALIRRFAKHDMKNGKGRATCKDTFYGFRDDMWSAFAVGVVHLDKRQEERLKRRLNG